jgi:hypothetical protein
MREWRINIAMPLRKEPVPNTYPLWTHAKPPAE